MDITMVKVYPVQEDKLKAFVSVVFDHCFMVNDIKVIQGKDGLFLSMPSRRKKTGEFKDVAHPLNNGTRRMLEERVLEEYRDIARDSTPRRPDRQPAMAHGAAVAVATPVAASSVVAQQGISASPVTPPTPAASPPPVTPAASAAEKTLEEVQEMHLSDSFWTVT